MARTVICIARVLGAGSVDVGKGVAEALHFRLVDDEILQLASATSDVSIETLASVEGRGANVSGDVSTDQLQAHIRESIDAAADRGDLVIMSHAASFALAGRDDVLRVLVTASPHTRASRVAEERGIDETVAASIVATDDDNRRDYLKRFYGTESESPLQYDMVLNTDVMALRAIVELIVCAAEVT
jgi:cytidylate kinase